MNLVALLLLASLLPNGDFEQPDPRDPTKPAGWDRVDGLGVQWVSVAGHGKAIRMNTAVSEQDMVAQWTRSGLTKYVFANPGSNPIADTYGLSYSSDFVPVKSNQAYRIRFDYRGASGGGKVWVRGYGLHAGERRRLYETIVFCRTPDRQWHTLTQVFFPTKARPEVTEMAVMLFAYHPAGEYWFDNVRLEPISAAEYESERSSRAR